MVHVLWQAQGLPIILTGDFNLYPESEPIGLIKTFMEDSREVTETPPYGPVGTFTRFDWNAPMDKRIDYIFVQGGIKVLKYAVLTHGTDVWYLKNGFKYEGLKNADTILTVSAYTKNKLIANGISECKIGLLKDAIDTSFFHPKPINNKLMTSLGLENKRILLTVGRTRSDERYKGHDAMLSVMEKLGSEYVWLVIGAGADLPRLKLKAEKLGIINKTRFLGNVTRENLVDYYNLCDCFVMPSKGEGFGIVFLEALACGKPVIAGNKDGSLEPLMNGRLGFAVDPDNSDEIIKAVRIACSAKKDMDHVRRGIKEVETNFGIAAFNKKVKEIFSGELERG